MLDKSYNWVITLFLHTTDRCWEEIVQEYISTNQLKFMAMGQETCPDTGTLHYQCYACFPSKIRLKTITRLFPGCHAEIMRGSMKQNEQYCSKEGTLIKYGTEPHQGQRSDLIGVKHKIDEGAKTMDLAEEDQHFAVIARYNKFFEKYENYRFWKKVKYDYTQPEVYIRVGEPGSGKTKYCYEYDRDLYRMPDKTLKWAGNYNHQSTVLFDDVKAGEIPPITTCLEITDRYPCELPVKGGFVAFKPKTIFFTSNHEPCVWWKDYNEQHYRAFMRRVKKIVRVYKHGSEEEVVNPYNGEIEEIRREEDL